MSIWSVSHLPLLPDELAAAIAAATAEWPSARTRMATEAAVDVLTNGERESLEAIAERYGVSRETVRRARLALVRALDSNAAPAGAPSGPTPAPGLPDETVGRALRRLLTLTGPLAWDEILTAWSRARGREPYTPLPSTATPELLQRLGEISIVEAGRQGEQPIMAAAGREPLDRVGAFLHATLGTRSAGLDRTEIVASAAKHGLRASTISTALSQHPALVRLSRGTWGIRGSRVTAPSADAPLPARRKRTPRRRRPTSFRWDPDGQLVIEFDVPTGPSPVIAIPRAVGEFLEGKAFVTDAQDRSGTIVVAGLRAWGFGRELRDLDLSPGSRAELHFDLTRERAHIQVPPTEVIEHD